MCELDFHVPLVVGILLMTFGDLLYTCGPAGLGMMFIKIGICTAALPALYGIFQTIVA